MGSSNTFIVSGSAGVASDGTYDLFTDSFDVSASDSGSLTIEADAGSGATHVVLKFQEQEEAAFSDYYRRGDDGDMEVEEVVIPLDVDASGQLRTFRTSWLGMGRIRVAAKGVGGDVTIVKITQRLDGTDTHAPSVGDGVA